MNIGVHHLGCRGYPGKEDVWEKEDQAYERAQVENPWHKYKDPKTQRFLRSRYHKVNDKGEIVKDPTVVQGVHLVTDDKVKNLETIVVSNLPA